MWAVPCATKGLSWLWMGIIVFGFYGIGKYSRCLKAVQVILWETILWTVHLTGEKAFLKTFSRQTLHEWGYFYEYTGHHKESIIHTQYNCISGFEQLLSLDRSHEGVLGRAPIGREPGNRNRAQQGINNEFPYLVTFDQLAGTRWSA